MAIGNRLWRSVCMGLDERIVSRGGLSESGAGGHAYRYSLDQLAMESVSLAIHSGSLPHRADLVPRHNGAWTQSLLVCCPRTCIARPGICCLPSSTLNCRTSPCDPPDRSAKDESKENHESEIPLTVVFHAQVRPTFLSTLAGSDLWP